MLGLLHRQYHLDIAPKPLFFFFCPSPSEGKVLPDPYLTPLQGPLIKKGPSPKAPHPTLGFTPNPQPQGGKGYALWALAPLG